MTTPYVLIVLDGWGFRDGGEDNAIARAKTPVWDELWRQRPHSLISASGLDVGLPSGQMGNSEVGHMNLGAGRVAHQDLTRINGAVEDGSFYRNPILLDLMRSLSATGNRLHILGLASPGGVHSHEDQIKAACKLAFDEGVETVYLHAFLDGRDVPPSSAEPSLETLQHYISDRGKGGVASIVGRFYAMDRDSRWERTERAYRLVADAEAELSASDAVTALHEAYSRGETDEFVQPTLIANDDGTEIRDGDAVLFMNFRADRARQLTQGFLADQFTHFDRPRQPRLTGFVTLTQYSEDISAPCAFGPLVLSNGLGEHISALGKRQLRLAETEKYAHVTFFLSGGREAPYPLEDRILVPSPKVTTYDLQPTMSAPEVTAELVSAILEGEYDLIICNYANGDMVGHTGDLDAAIRAAESVDASLARVVSALKQVHGHCLITADHGNLERMTDHDTGQPHTAHTCEPVPLVYVGDRNLEFGITDGALRDVAPTLLDLMGVAPAAEMTGRSLLKETHKRAALT